MADYGFDALASSDSRRLSNLPEAITVLFGLKNADRASDAATIILEFLRSA